MYHLRLECGLLATRRRGLILVVVLFMIALLGLLAASYSLMVRAHIDTVIEEQERFKIRMAAEGGVQHAIAILRDRRGDLDAWHNNPELRRTIFLGQERDEGGGDAFEERVDDVRTFDESAEHIFRYSLIRPNFDENAEEPVAFGITDETSRLDLNVATDAQLRRLFEMVIPEDTDNDVDISVLVDSLLDWRTAGGSGRANGAKDEYYQSLKPPYRCKSAPFSTVEELLLVRGFTAWVVYGEDYNRNGMLDPNEDDGDEKFPPDNSDGELFRGIAPYFTIWSQEMNSAGDNQPRINLNLKDVDKLQEKLEEAGIDSDLVNYIIDVRSRGVVFNSVMNLIPAPPPPELEEGVEENETENQDPLENEETPPATQLSGDEAASQPADENRTGQGGRSTDQDGNKSGNQGAGAVPVYQNLTEEEPPGTYQDLPIILDRLTTDASPFYRGRINVSTAPRPVLAMLNELALAEVDAMVAARPELSSEDRSTAAWLLTQGVLDEYKFRQILPKITTKSSVYRIESVGFADHTGVQERIMVLVEMRGPIPQVLYYRNMNPLGVAYNPYGLERRDRTRRAE